MGAGRNSPIFEIDVLKSVLRITEGLDADPDTTFYLRGSACYFISKTFKQI